MKNHHVRVLPPSIDLAQREIGADLDYVQIKQHLAQIQGLMLMLDHLGAPLFQRLSQVTCACGQCATFPAPRHSDRSGESVLVLGTRTTLSQVGATLEQDPLQDCRSLGIQISTALDHTAPDADLGRCRIGQTDLIWGKRTYVMGIINATPDSFSGDGLLENANQDQVIQDAVDQALGFLNQGADILDIGGESTRPGSDPIEETQELRRVIPIIQALRQVTDAPISIDTYRATVARAALEAGANMINDVWGLRMDPSMAPLVAESKAPIVIMHNRSKPKDSLSEARLGGRYVGVSYTNLMGDIINELRAQISIGHDAGISDEQIIIDPGIGFGKTVAQNLYLVNHLDELSVLGYPILIGPSRKSFIGYTLDLPPEERVEGTCAAVALAIIRGAAHIVRVHDVQAIVRTARMTDALLAAT